MKVTANGTEFEVDLKDGATLSYKEGVAIEKVTGVRFVDLAKQMSAGSLTLEMIGAVVWVLIKRTDPTVRFDAVDFDLNDIYDQDEPEETPEVPASGDDPLAVPPAEATNSSDAASAT